MKQPEGRVPKADCRPCWSSGEYAARSAGPALLRPGTAALLGRDRWWRSPPRTLLSATTAMGQDPTVVAERFVIAEGARRRYAFFTGMSHQPNNIAAGTQIVSLVEVRGTNNSLVHPRGAVGVVTRTPTGDQTQFLVRFPDGFEASLNRDQLEVLKHFKDRLPGAESAAEQFDLESLVIYRCVVGSRAYGLDNDESDTDRRGIYLAPAELQWSLFGAPEQFEDNASQSCYWELQKFLGMALKANPNILECLYSPLVEKTTPLAEELLAMRQGFLSRMIFQTFNGYAMSQFKKIEQDIRNHGDVRWKHAMHLLRLLLTGAATLRERSVPVLVADHQVRDRLLVVNRGEMPWPEVDAWRKELHRDFELALAETKLPERPDYEAANGLLIKARREMANHG